MDLKLGDFVDSDRTPQNKDASGWIGPAQVVNLTDLASGRIDVKWQGYIYSCQVRHVRPALIFFTFYFEVILPTNVLSYVLIFYGIVITAVAYRLSQADKISESEFFYHVLIDILFFQLLIKF